MIEEKIPYTVLENKPQITPLESAMRKLGNDDSKVIHLSPREAAAVMAEIRALQQAIAGIEADRDEAWEKVNQLYLDLIEKDHYELQSANKELTRNLFDMVDQRDEAIREVERLRDELAKWKPTWEDFPDRAIWMAQNERGKTHLFDHQPVPVINGVWGGEWLLPEPDAQDTFKGEVWVTFNKRWRETLEERP